MARPRLLLISYLFPPAGGIAVQRALSLAKYLPDCGYDVHVLRACGAAQPVHDPSLLRHIPAGVRVHGAFTPEIPFAVRQKLWHKLRGTRRASAGSGGSAGDVPAQPSWWKRAAVNQVRRLLCPEPEILWVPFALRKAWRLVQKYEIGTVLITAPPFSAFLVGVELKRRAPGLRLVSDFRDEWLDFYLKDFEFQSGEYTRRRAAEIERQTVEASDLVVSTTTSTRDVMRRRYADQPEHKFTVVANGYDPAAFDPIRPDPKQSASALSRRPSDGKMVVTHVGTVYKTACPRYYLDALDGMDAPVREQIRTRFVGRVAEDERAVLEGRRSAVEITGFVPQPEALRAMHETDCLLLTMTNDISLPGKLFEYMATGKPILALCSPSSEVARILEETGAGWHADPADRQAVQAMVARAHREFQQGELGRREVGEAVRRYERPRLAAEYARQMMAAG